MRLIDADALRAAMYHEAFENDASYDEKNPLAKWDSGLWVRYKMFESCLESAPSIDAVPQWIPCSEVTGEGYPKEEGFYYVTERNYGFYLETDVKQNIAHTSNFFNGDFTDRFYDRNHSNIVAWMPLPKPYKGEE